MNQTENIQRAQVPEDWAAARLTLMDEMGLAACYLLLDDGLPLLAANQRLKKLWQLTSDAVKLKQLLTEEAYDKLMHSLLHLSGEQSQCSELLSLKIKGLTDWQQVDMTVTNQTVNGKTVLSAVFHDMNILCHKQATSDAEIMTRIGQIEWLMSEYAGNVYISDMDNYELLYVNEKSCETLNRPKEKLIGKKCYEAIQGRSAPCPFCTNHLLKKDETYAWEFYNPSLDRTFMIKDRMLEWEGRRARIELSHDMLSTEYKLAKKDQEREAIIKTIPGGLLRIDARDYDTVLWYSDELLKLIGYTGEQFKTELDSKCSYIHPEDMDRVYKSAKALNKTGQNAVLQARIITRSKEERMLTMTLCYISGEDSWDRIPSIYSVGIDITEEHLEQERQRKALEDAYNTAKVANEAKTNFLSSMSHDIRTPMNAIVGMTVIAQANLNQPQRVADCLNKIDVSSRHLLNLINEVLDMSKIESGKIDLMLENIKLPELLQNVTDMCKPLLVQKNLDFQITVGHLLHENVVADGDRLQQILMNLLSNAIKYTQEGGTIRLAIEEHESMIDGRERYEFVISDNGIGMSADFIPHIFEPFSRAEDTRISKTQGTGLGMTITENIIHMMNGTIEVKSELGKGSEFTVSLPLQVCHDAQEQATELINQTVLIVDDDQTVCESAALLLEELGMQTRSALSGAAALAELDRISFSHKPVFAVLLDWKMPDMDGLETLKQIRLKAGNKVAVIIMSAYDFSGAEEVFIKAGADAFITKPLFKSKLLHILKLYCMSSKHKTANAFIEEKHTDLQGKRILLVEDNQLNREIAMEILNMQGLCVETAVNGKEAVEMFKQSTVGKYDAILMDIQMPVMNGYEATEAIRAFKREDANTIPIFALTANAFITDIVKAQNAGMNGHIAKPIDVEILIKTLQKWIV